MDNKLKVAYVDSLSAFCGINKILEKLGSFYYWPNLVSDVKNFINNCKVSKTTNYPNRTLCPPMGTLAKRIEFSRNFMLILSVPTYAVVLAMSGFFLKPVKKFTANAICRYLEDELFRICM